MGGKKGGKGKGGGGGGNGSRSSATSSRKSSSLASAVGLEGHSTTVGAVVAGIGAIVMVIWLVSPPADTDRVSALINSAVPEKYFGDTTDEHGKAIAEALNLRKLMQDIVDTTPGASFVTEDPPIIQFENFMTPEECEAMIEAGKPGLKASTGTGQLKDGRFERTMIAGRTSYNAWCMAPLDCPDDPTIQSIDARIANVTGFSYRNMEYYQILRYSPKQEYQAHSDFIELQKSQPSGPRIFTFFLYLNDVAEDQSQSGGGTTWFPQAKVNSSAMENQDYWRSPEKMAGLTAYYDEYNNKEMRKTMDPPSVKFSHIGYRATPKVGSAIMWPNTDLDNIYKQNPGTTHAADELLRGHTKWAANAWIHLRDFRTPHAKGLTG